MTTFYPPTSGSHDFSKATLSDIDTIQFNPGGYVIFSSAQFDGVQILNNVTLKGGTSSNYLFVHLDDSHTTLDARGWQFESWNDPYDQIIRLDGSSGNDVIHGPNQGSSIFGFGGTNQMFGGSGDDTIVSNEDDFADKIDGGTGNDYVIVYRSGSTAAFTINLLHGGGGTDIGDGTTLKHFDGLLFEGGSGSDRVVGGNGLSDTLLDNLSGGGGNDFLKGLDGNDQLNGGTGNDTLIGDAGDDSLAGGEGRDVMTGGAGADVFVFTTLSESAAGAQRDVIRDFVSGVDAIDLSAVDAINGSDDDPFTFIGDKAFSHKAGQLHFHIGANVTMVSADTDGDGKADFQISLQGQHALVESDFIL
ncbi:calcium-binding protein [Aestuariivirga sp.]|uniref:calcium-binding protein n=1 Tax=Aestuariivirga sp. TaxID=2650926 RepID=UPI0039E338F7